MSQQRLNHALIYRIGLVMVFLFFLGFMVAVFTIAQMRYSGSTGIDADKMGEVRARAIEKMAIEP